MRFVVQHKKASYINFLVLIFSTGAYFYIFLFPVYKYLTEEFFPKQIILALKGNPEEFLEPKDILSIMESLHIELFLLLVFFLTVSSILIRTSIKDKIKIYLIFSGFLSVFMYVFSIFGVKFLSDVFSYFYFISIIFIFLTGFFINSINIVCFITGKIK